MVNGNISIRAQTCAPLSVVLEPPDWLHWRRAIALRRASAPPPCDVSEDAHADDRRPSRGARVTTMVAAPPSLLCYRHDYLFLELGLESVGAAAGRFPCLSCTHRRQVTSNTAGGEHAERQPATATKEDFGCIAPDS